MMEKSQSGPRRRQVTITRDLSLNLPVKSTDYRVFTESGAGLSVAGLARPSTMLISAARRMTNAMPIAAMAPVAATGN